MGIRHGIRAAGAFLLLATSAAGAAHAQGTSLATTPDGRFSFGLGAFRPDDRAVRAGTGEAWAMISADYRLRRPSPSRLIEPSVYLDIASGSKRQGTRYREEFYEFSRVFYGAGLAARINVVPPTAGRNRLSAHLTVGGGGYYLGRARAYVYPGYDGYGYPDYDSEQRDVIYRRGRLNLGYRLGGGLRFGRGYYAEFTRFNLGRLGAARYDGFSLAAGATF
jgi:hypothetical protein